uniref:Uncharacterized protein n=1 Tax=Rhizophora mucronata TaxID=61149 RepID=A0A2P2JRG6_RHIMU
MMSCWAGYSVIEPILVKTEFVRGVCLESKTPYSFMLVWRVGFGF